MSVAAAFCLLLSGSLISFFPHSFTFTILPFLFLRVLFCPDSVSLVLSSSLVMCTVLPVHFSWLLTCWENELEVSQVFHTKA